MNYDGVERLRNITFPTPESSREVNLSCPIRPGALSERYSVRWISSVPGTGAFRLIPNSNKYDITVSHASSSLDQYECQVTVMHRIGQGVLKVTRRYDGPMIVIKKYGESTDTEKCIVRVQQCGYYVYILYVFVTQLGILIFSCVAVLATVENDVQNVSIIEGDYVSNEVCA